MGDPAAKETWPPGRQEYQMKDQLARQTITMLQKEVEELKDEIKELKRRK